MRLIDADKIVYSWQIDADGNEHDGVTLQSIIDKMPTIEERKTGKWIREGSAFNLRCPYCRRFFVEPVGSKFNYCPSCGADMRGKGNGTG